MHPARHVAYALSLPWRDGSRDFFGCGLGELTPVSSVRVCRGVPMGLESAMPSAATPAAGGLGRTLCRRVPATGRRYVVGHVYVYAVSD